ncbi:MAG: heavy metal translocating P-type ATPase [Gammaproteobacteria bacterium]|nr:heavy metal translocating P-type ATPase [Gammaproteobacteria bacterium]MBU1624744.1 heavy metal translocating P-type ATPase [Gammaproteobacteria bacterium]MBU1982588.1 heavy metal translocating P-type ATPase [Gammaproteobacteria bacterium]
MSHGNNISAGCFHCGLPIPADTSFSSVLEGRNRDFCCFGCQSVCGAIYEADLQGYYQRTPEGVLLGPPPEPPKDIDIYDFDEVQQEFTSCSGDERAIHLLVEGIHCAACVWLIERGLKRVPGVLSVEVNLATKRLHLKWDNSRAKLSDLIKALVRIGYSAVPYDPESAEGASKRTNRAMLFRLFFAGFAAMNMMWIAIALYSGADRDEFRSFFHWMGLLLATPTLLYSGYPFFKGAAGGLRAGHLTMDLPIVLGLSVTFAYSLYVTLTNNQHGEVYFDTVTNLTFVILIGRYLEGMFRHQALSATKRLMELQPRVAMVIKGGVEKMTPIRAVMLGDQVMVKPGYTVPVDGVVLEGRSAVDESMLSGESVPVHKHIGDVVSAGTVNTSGALLVEVRTQLQDTTLSKIIRLVEEAQSSKAPIQRLADTIVPWFVLVTLLCAGVTFFFWNAHDFELALMAATSVLIITCPCALGMATPMSIAVASGLGAKHGILVKNGLVLETLSKVTHFVFDKTGSLTEGKMSVSRSSVATGVNAQEMIAKAAAAERYSEHSTARALVNLAEQQELAYRTTEVGGFHATAGLGIAATVEGREIRLGSASWLVQSGVVLDEALQKQAHGWESEAISCVYMACAGRHVAIFGLADQLRGDAQQLVDELREAGIGMTLLSGDRRPVAEAIAKQLGGMEVIAEVMPQDKDQVIQSLQKRGEIVAMVGDGVNDAPALIRANVGIALGSGTDVSIDSADIVLMHNELSKVLQATRLSRRTLLTIKQNIGLSFIYNLIMVPLAMMAKVSPLVAAITMPISSLIVIGNAARIRTMFRK